MFTEGVTVSAEALSESSLIIKWSSSPILQEAAIVYQAVFSDGPLQNIQNTTARGLVSPVNIANLETGTLYEINLYGLLQSKLIAVTLYVNTGKFNTSWS